MAVVSSAFIGAAATFAWLADGHPQTRTRAFSIAFQVGLALSAAVALLSPKQLRRRRFAAVASCVFVATETRVLITGIAALWIGTHHTGRAVANILIGTFGLLLFGGAPILNRRFYGPNNAISPDLAAKAGPPSGNAKAVPVDALLADGRQVRATLVLNTYLVRLPKGVTAGDVVDLRTARHARLS